jgi:heptaprenyl diphosphate synthase
MSAYADIRAYLDPDLVRFEEKLTQVIAAQHDYLSEAERQLYRCGKRLRPLLLFLCARLVQRGDDRHEPLADRVVMAGVSLEMLHIASLIHDDVIDVAMIRRGTPTINALRGNDLAIVIGDLQFIEAARTFVALADARQDLPLLKRYLDAAWQVCRGQIDELLADPSGSPEALLKRYLRTIDRKTARLIAFACEGGARLTGTSVANVSALTRFGMHLGRAFQMMDDVLDFLQGGEAWGKRRFQDLSQRRLSLPVVLQLGRLPADALLWQWYRGADLPAATIDRLGGELAASNALLEAYSQARIQAEEAKSALYFLPAGEAHIVDQGFLDTGSKRGEWNAPPAAVAS